MAKISSVSVFARTVDDNKEDAQFEVDVKQGVNNILQVREGGGVNWDDGDFQEFNFNLDVPVTGETIEVITACQDGPWGRRNHWNAQITVIIRTDDGLQLEFSRHCAFRTASKRPRHEFHLGTKKFSTHGIRF